MLSQSDGIRLMIAGSRSIKSADIAGIIRENVPGHERISEIICGGARGVDELAAAYADKQGIKKTVVPPDYKKYARRAPIVRNAQMADMADFVLVIWDGNSSGSGFVQEYCRKNLIPGKCVIIDTGGAKGSKE